MWERKIGRPKDWFYFPLPHFPVWWNSLYLASQCLPETATIDLPIQSFVARLQIFFAEDVALHPDFGRQPSIDLQLTFEVGAIEEDFEPQFSGVDIDQNQIACSERIFDSAPGEDASAHGVVGLGQLSARVSLGERSEERILGLCDYPRAISQAGNGRRDLPVAQAAQIDFGDVLQLEDDLDAGIDQHPPRHGLAVLLVFGDLPGVEAEDVARAKGRAAIGVKEAVLRFVEHRP